MVAFWRKRQAWPGSECSRLRPPFDDQCRFEDDESEQLLSAGAEPDSENNHSSALTSNVLTSPAKVTEKLTGPNSQPVVHIPLPGWVWNLERRKQCGKH